MSVIYQTNLATEDKQDDQIGLLSQVISQLQSLNTSEDDSGVIAKLQSILSELQSQSGSEATAANQVSGNTTLSSILSALSGVSTAANQATAIASLAAILSRTNLLSTEAKQDAANALLTSINDKIGSSNAAITSLSQSNVTAVDLLAANPNRKGFLLFNDSGQKAYVSLGSPASASVFSILLAANSGYEATQAVVFKGSISALWNGSGSGKMRVTELT
jgi:hypothetical protein